MLSLANNMRIEGHGLITGQAVTCTLSLGEVGSGIVFIVNGHKIKACASLAVHTERGVTLKAPHSEQTLSIVEHFLGAVSLLGLQDVLVQVNGAPELPILDGSAEGWLTALQALQQQEQCKLSPSEPKQLSGALYYDHSLVNPTSTALMLAVPAPSFRLTYSVDFPHPLTQQRFAYWDSATDEPALLLKARTFGFVRDLPALQAKGLALGANINNTLGLQDDGSTSSPLRFDEEPVYHKMLDLIGDFKLCGLNALQLKLHIYALEAGHGSHIAFAQQLKQAVTQMP
jgi:UDP-3-O-[3-hydroxymyristoyl] N-acetylglucosamine deacetylase